MVIELEVYKRTAPKVKADIIPFRIDPKCVEEIRGPGAGSFRLHASDPRAQDENLLSYRNIVKFRENGKIVNAMLIQNIKTIIADKQEAAGELIDYSGEGLRTWFRDATLYPYGGLQKGSYDSRHFSFASEQGTWYNPAEWITPVNVGKYLTPPWWETAPAGWPDVPNAQWIWDRTQGYPPAKPYPPLGICYFRAEFDLTVTTRTQLFITGDNSFIAYMDGQEIIHSDKGNWRETFTEEMVLAPGHHILAVKIQNEGAQAGLLAALRSWGDVTAPTAATNITVTGDSKWKMLPYPAQEPGWTIGEILLTLLAEAKARGVEFASLVSPTFTDTLDSAGVPWNDKKAWSFDIGVEYREIIEKMEELSCDVWIDPDNYELNVVKRRGVDRSVQTLTDQPVQLRIGKNVVKASEDGSADIKNVLMIKTEEGWKVEEDSEVSTSPYGRVEGKIDTDASIEFSKSVAKAAFEMKATPEISADYEYLATSDIMPYEKFDLGDWVLAPGPSGTYIKRRVMSISLAEDDNTGAVQYASEFDTIYRDREDYLTKWLEALTGGGSLSGALSNQSFSGGNGVKSSSGGTGTGGGGGGGATLLIPAAPQSLAARSYGVLDSDGQARSQTELSWAPVSLDENGASLSVPRYQVWAIRNRTLAERTITNLVSNPSFESNLTGVTAVNSSISQSAAWAKQGSRSLRIDPSLVSNNSYATLDGGPGGMRSGFIAGATFTVSATFRQGDMQTGSLHPNARTLSVVTVGPNSGTQQFFSSPAPNVSGEFEISLQVSIPGDATQAYIVVYNGTSASTAQASFWDAIQVTLGTEQVPFFDGNTQNTADVTYTWLGTGNNSQARKVITDRYSLVKTVRSNYAEFYLPGTAESWNLSVTALSDYDVPSALAAAVSTTTLSSTEALPQPDAPSLTSRLGTITVYWNGRLSGQTPERQFSHVYIGMSNSPSGPFDTVGQAFLSAGTATISGVANGDTKYIVLYAVTKNGIVSFPSAAVQILVTDSSSGPAPETPSRIAYGIVEPAYSSGKPKVQLAGALGYTGGYSFLASYDPQSSDPVALARDTGGDYLILGKTAIDRMYPRYNELTLSGAVNYGGGWDTAGFAKTVEGYVHLKGLVTLASGAAGTVIATLPEGFRPDYNLIFGTNNSDAARALQVQPDGKIMLRSGISNSTYISLSSIVFPAAGVANWTSISNFASGWSAFTAEPGFGPPRYWKDQFGLVWLQGMVTNPTTPTVDNTTMVTIPTTHAPQFESHVITAAGDNFGYIDWAATNGTIRWKNGSTSSFGYVNLTGGPIPAADNSLQLAAGGMANGYARYNTNFPIPGTMRTPGGLVVSQGLMTTGTVNTTAFIPAETHRPGGRSLRHSVSGQARGRIDLYGGAQVALGLTPAQQTSPWHSIDGHAWIAQQ